MSERIMNSLLKAFGQSIGMPDLKMDEENRCNLLFDDMAVSFELSEKQNSMYIYSQVAALTTDERDKVSAALLDANYVFRGTGGAAFGVEQETGSVVLIREERLEGFQLSQFEPIVETFVNLVEDWQQKLQELLMGNGGAKPEPPDMPSTPNPGSFKV